MRVLIRRSVKTAAIFAGSFLAFVATLFLGLRFQVWIYGADAFEDDAGASFAAFISSGFAATLIAMAVGYLLYRVLRSGPSIHDPFGSPSQSKH